MKTTITAFACVSLLTVSMTSCFNDWLDRMPDTSVSKDDAIHSTEDLTTARTGMYTYLKGTSSRSDYYGARMIYYGEVRGEDMQADKLSPRAMSSYTLTFAAANTAPSIWVTPYRLIGRANRLLDAINTADISDRNTENGAKLIAQYTAEAKVIRALAHFDLVRVYAQPYTQCKGDSLGVPIISKVEKPGVQLGRNTVAEVYTKVIQDLTEAIDSKALVADKLPGYVNLWAAKAWLCRVYLTMGNDKDALEVAEDIIQNSPYRLWTNSEYVDAWKDNDGAHSKEIIYESVITNNKDWVDREGISYLYAEDGYKDIVATRKFVDMLGQDPNDVRNGIFLSAQTSAGKATYGNAKVFLNKYPRTNAEADVRLADIPLLRLSEVYLNAAEAAMNLQNKGKAATYLDAIVNRANPAKHVTAADVTTDLIRIERRKELVGEGHRFFDAMRNNETIVRYTNEGDMGWHVPLQDAARSYDRTWFKSLLPIPQGEVNANPVIAKEQNPGY